MRKILRRHAFSITFLAILIGFIFLSGDRGDMQRFAGFTMGTTYNLQVVDLPAEPEVVAGELEEVLNRLDRDIFSTYAPGSEVSRLNRHVVGEPFPASRALLDVLILSREISELSGGAFDITVAPLVNLWGFGPEPGPADDTIPPDAEIEEALAGVGYRYLEIDPAAAQIRKIRPLTIDLSAVAKGYAVDRLAHYFDELGVESYFLEVGGELKMKGARPGGNSWIPAIEAPDVAQSRLYEVLFSRGETIAVAGSGDYRNYFDADGVRYSHEIDPRTGRPVRHGLAAAYVIDESAARADALATAFIVMGLEPSRQLATRLGLAVYLIYKPAGEEAGFAHFASDQFNRYLNE